MYVGFKMCLAVHSFTFYFLNHFYQMRVLTHFVKVSYLQFVAELLP